MQRNCEMCIRDSLFERAENDLGGLLIEMVGGEDNVAGLFDFSNYNLTSWITQQENIHFFSLLFFQRKAA